LATVFEYCKAIGVDSSGVYIKPKLTERHCKERELHCLNQVDTTDQSNLVYKSHQNRIHQDEKFFFTKPLRKNVKFLPDHGNPLDHSTQDKSHIPKLMVGIGISEPTDDFDCKVGIYPHEDLITAARNSRNRPRGTIELKPKSVDAEEFFWSQTHVDDDISKTGNNCFRQRFN
jgi:hypothetical protein